MSKTDKYPFSTLTSESLGLGFGLGSTNDKIVAHRVGYVIQLCQVTFIQDTLWLRSSFQSLLMLPFLHSPTRNEELMFPLSFFKLILQSGGGEVDSSNMLKPYLLSHSWADYQASRVSGIPLGKSVTFKTGKTLALKSKNKGLRFKGIIARIDQSHRLINTKNSFPIIQLTAIHI